MVWPRLRCVLDFHFVSFKPAHTDVKYQLSCICSPKCVARCRYAVQWYDGGSPQREVQLGVVVRLDLEVNEGAFPENFAVGNTLINNNNGCIKSRTPDAIY